MNDFQLDCLEYQYENLKYIANESKVNLDLVSHQRVALKRSTVSEDRSDLSDHCGV